MTHALLSRVCFERYGVSNEVVSSYRDHHKTISCVAQCGLYLASRLNIYWRVFTVSALCKTNYVSHGSRGALTSPHSLGVVSHKHTNILKTSSAAGWARLNTSPCYLLLFKSFHIFGFINQMTGCY